MFYFFFLSEVLEKHISLRMNVYLRAIFNLIRSAIEHEKKGHAENYEHGQVMEKNLLTMARELEKLRAEMANAEKRARAAATVNPNPGMKRDYAFIRVCLQFFNQTAYLTICE